MDLNSEDREVNRNEQVSFHGNTLYFANISRLVISNPVDVLFFRFIMCNLQEMVNGSGSSFWQWPWWLGGSLFRSVYHYLFGELVSLNDALAAFFLPDDLCGENMYSCEKCAKYNDFPTK